VLRCVGALEAILASEGAPIATGVAVEAARSALASA
jgi:hypothetical protein